MLKQAYEYGVLLAFQEKGLVKKAGPAYEGAKILMRDAGKGIKNYFTGTGVRGALENVTKAKLPGAVPKAMTDARKKAIKSLMPYLLPVAGIGGLAALPSGMRAVYPNY